MAPAISYILGVLQINLHRHVRYKTRRGTLDPTTSSRYHCHHSYLWHPRVATIQVVYIPFKDTIANFQHRDVRVAERALLKSQEVQ